MKENFKSGSMRGGWRGLFSMAWRSEHRWETAGERAPACRGSQTSRLLSPVGCPHDPPSRLRRGPFRTIQVSAGYDTRVETTVSQRLGPECHSFVSQLERQ